MIKVIGFDIGGTLMEYKNMPNVWIDYYKTGFETVLDFQEEGVSQVSCLGYR